MKRRWAIGTVLVIAVLVTLPGNAQDMAAEGREPCGIEGTWFGVNSAGFNFVFRMEKNAAGRFTDRDFLFPTSNVARPSSFDLAPHTQNICTVGAF
jgi:hypothetical protein